MGVACPRDSKPASGYPKAGYTACFIHGTVVPLCTSTHREAQLAIATKPRFNSVIANYSPGVRKLATGLRSLIRECAPGADEHVDQATKVIGYGFGAGYKGLICTIILGKFELKLGFNRGLIGERNCQIPRDCSPARGRYISTL